MANGPSGERGNGRTSPTSNINVNQAFAANVGQAQSAVNVGTSAFNAPTMTIEAALEQDIQQNQTPVIPAGAFDYGSGKVYTAFTIEDIVEGNSDRVTRPGS